MSAILAAGVQNCSLNHDGVGFGATPGAGVEVLVVMERIAACPVDRRMSG